MRRRCNKCGKSKPLTADYFHHDQSMTAGFHFYCKLCQRQKTRSWSLAHPDQVRTTNRAWRIKHHERIVRRIRAWKLANPDKVALYRERERPANVIRAAQWNQAHRDRHRLLNRACEGRRRAQKRKTETHRINLTRILIRDRWRCHVCGHRVSWPTLHFDHLMPLARGGSHTEDNIRVSHAQCNLRKGTKVLSCS